MSNCNESSNIRIFLVRHGETEWNRIHRLQGRSDLPLNRRGRNQARALGLALKDKSFAAIYSSPLVRAVETAQLINVHHPSTPMFKEHGLIEMDLGDFDGLDARCWAKKYPDYKNAWEKNPAAVKIPGGESLTEVQVRAIETLKRITEAYPPDAILLICSHNFVILSILCYALKIPLDEFRQLKQENAAYNILSKQGNRLYVELVNECSHLQRNIGKTA